MALAAMLLVTVATADGYSYAEEERNLASSWTWTPVPASGNPTSASCYNKEYSYYTSWKCTANTDDNCKPATTDANTGQSYCESQTDPQDTYEQDKKDRRNRLLAICIPSILGGCLVLACFVGCCALYFGGKYGYDYYEAQKNGRGKKRSK